MSGVELTTIQQMALRAVRDGGDVYGDDVARTLRQMQSIRPAIIRLCRPRSDADTNGREPHFGAVATRRGRALLHTIDDQLPPCIGESMHDTERTIQRRAAHNQEH